MKMFQRTLPLPETARFSLKNTPACGKSGCKGNTFLIISKNICYFIYLKNTNELWESEIFFQREGRSYPSCILKSAFHRR